MNDPQHSRRRESFDEVADLYDRARPPYPDALLRDLIELSGLSSNSRVLEVGCGTGQITVPLAELGVSLVAVELGANLAAITRDKVSRYEGVSVCVANFDTWRVPTEQFDLVVAATAFHWLDPVTRVGKCADALRPGGTLAIIDTQWGAGITGDDPFLSESQACYARWDPNHRPGFVPPRLNDLPQQREDLVKSGRFEQVRLKRYVVERSHSAETYCDLISTFSDIRGFDEANRTGFLACMRNLIESRFENRIIRHDVHDLWIARTPASRVSGV